MTERRPTVYDVAKQANVSIATVSFAFRRPDQISAATRTRVLDVARELGYAPSAAARGLARGKTGALGLHSFDLLLERPQDGETEDVVAPPEAGPPDGESLIPWNDAHDDVLADPRAFPLYVDEVQRGFELEARAHGRPVMLSSGSDTTVSVAESAGRVDGLAIFPVRSAAASLAAVSLRMPIVLFSTPPADDDHHRVLADNAGGMGALVRHLVREHGITDLAFVGALRVADYRARFDAYREALADLGIATAPTALDETLLGEGRGYGAVVEAIRTGRLPRALVCASDQLALALLDVLTAHGVDVPGDVVVTGFDGIFAGRVSQPPLTTVRQPMEAMGRAAARLLMESLRRSTPAPARVLRLETRLVVRRSCGCPG